MSDLQRLSGLVSDLLDERARVSQLEEELSEAKARARAIEQRDIPELMDNIELTQAVFDGMRITLGSKIRTSIPKDSKDLAMQWLEDNGHSGAMKRAVKAQFSKEQEQEALDFLAEATGQFDCKIEREVHPQTLAKILKDELGEGKDVPLELFGAWEERKVTLKDLKN